MKQVLEFFARVAYGAELRQQVLLLFEHALGPATLTPSVADDVVRGEVGGHSTQALQPLRDAERSLDHSSGLGRRERSDQEQENEVSQHAGHRQGPPSATPGNSVGQVGDA